jgi:hypothetical protein
MRKMEKERDFIHSFIYSFIHSTLGFGFQVSHVLVNHLDVNYFGVWLVGWPAEHPQKPKPISCCLCLERTNHQQFLVPFLSSWKLEGRRTNPPFMHGN